MTLLYAVCAAAGCRRTIPKGQRLCAEHKAADEARRAGKRRRFGYSRSNWQRIRAQRLVFAAGRCELGLPRCTGAATHVHLDPRLAGNHDLATFDDCRACCASCSGAVDAPRSRQ